MGDDVVAEVGDCLALLSLDNVRELQFALINARLPHSTAPIATAIVEPSKPVPTDAPLALVPCDRPDKDVEPVRVLRQEMLKDKVTLIVHRDSDTAGTFGETKVVVLMEGELRRYALLGTQEWDAALKEFTLKAAAKRRSKRGLLDTDDDEEEED